MLVVWLVYLARIIKHNEPLRHKKREDFVFLPNPLAADQLFRKIFAFIAREKVKRDPDKGLVIHIPVFDQFDKAGALLQWGPDCFRFHDAEYLLQRHHPRIARPWLLFRLLWA